MIHMNLNCQLEIKLQSTNWLPGMLPLLLWPTKLLLGIVIGAGNKLSHTGVCKKQIEDLNWSSDIQLGERKGQSVSRFLDMDTRLYQVE
jgi:hypothetical protein